MVSLYFLGNPGTYGGATSEAWHTLKLWRKAGFKVDVIPTWSAQEPMRRKLEGIGCTVHDIPGPDLLLDVPGIRDGVVVGMCNAEFLGVAEKLRVRGRCKLVWINCMCWMFDREIDHYKRLGPFHRYVFQSEYQRSCLFPRLSRYGVAANDCAVIHGAFDREEWQSGIRPHPKDSEFFVGRLSRADADKFSSNSWKIYGAIPYRPLRVRVMGWNPEFSKKLGDPPKGLVEVMPPNYMTAQAFLAELHCYMQINGGAKENWPRSGLEAMAAGVPIVAQDEWGWREMVDHGKTGFLGRNDQELAYYAARLAYDEDLRVHMAMNARIHLGKLTDDQVLGGKWKAILEGLQ